ncbi:glutamine--fructose-6-phosphate transaminase (isomerizing) [Desulforamulus ruminis]|uniref:Glutamine--fructose-6-phosphate aminotransferase [isomerizing] n=1 Tax=Desulforamulus ruminis (strain ATCC 23193 / DSM 2154 / NCIMB 8452 / DL) TaxID=696281 RepID=F6DQU3_DESRL|nr:glutamine--fructose-6-phosphate transaminase (isomerizing) [Desulforamulus ruminis]AEG58667.1 glucosamine/fructose-6-phosphate aminotransferase, isomerizing [Desulforamulus ruminis DSM 2154]
MCGVVGYVGLRPATPVIVEGLKKLEYRGYDSSGVAVLDKDGLKVEKKMGRLSELEKALNGKVLDATIGIGHTRWATHGRPSDVNAHPHTSNDGKIAVVHNGIIENYLQLREWLSSMGHVFKSETDTEVIPHLIEHFYNGDLIEAVQKTVSHLEGSYAIMAISIDQPGRIVAVRQDMPMVVGLGQGENLLASDIPALLKYTRQCYLLNDGDVVELRADQVIIRDVTGKIVQKDIFEVTWDAEEAEKGGYEHFMLKEIHEQPRVIRDTLKGRISHQGDKVILDEINLTPQQIKGIKKIIVTACGTAYHAGLVGKYIIEQLVRIPVEVDIASEFRYRDPIVDKDTLVVVVSQSGETADTLAALREARRRGARVVAITNVIASSVAREADDIIYTWAGPEISVASTKAYTTQLVALYLLALYLAQERNTLAAGNITEILNELKAIYTKAQEVLDNEQPIKEFAEKYHQAEDTFFIGRGLDYAVALEGSLKLKEISYIHAEAYAAGELKHGTLALIVENIPVIALATQKSLFEKMVSNIKEVKARDASVIALAMEGHTEVEKVADQVIYIPKTHQVLAPILTVIPLQLLAYYMSVCRGCDVDKPRNLAKSVTVE